MPKAKMKFPPIPGKTPRAKFENLVRYLFTIGKNSADKSESRREDKTKVDQSDIHRKS
jgi:hypothetical protein